MIVDKTKLEPTIDEVSTQSEPQGIYNIVELVIAIGGGCFKGLKILL